MPDDIPELKGGFVSGFATPPVPPTEEEAKKLSGLTLVQRKAAFAEAEEVELVTAPGKWDIVQKELKETLPTGIAQPTEDYLSKIEQLYESTLALQTLAERSRTEWEELEPPSGTAYKDVWEMMGGVIWPFDKPGPSRREQEFLELRERRRALAEEIGVNLKNSLWISQALQIPLMDDYQGLVLTADDIAKLLPPPTGLTDEDMNMVSGMLDSLYAPVVSETGKPSVEFLYKKGRPAPVSMHLMTTDEILKALQSTALPVLPAGMSGDEVKDLFGYEDLDELVTENQRELISAWNEQNEMMELYTSGLAEAKIPGLTTWEVVKSAVLQPALASVDMIEKYRDYVSKPLSGIIITGARRATFRQPAQMERNFAEQKAEGANWYLAYGRAFDDLDWNWGAKLGIEIVSDPLTYFGIGIATKITKPIPYLNKIIPPAERAWIQLWDAPFYAGRELWKRIPRLPIQEGTLASLRATTHMRSAIVRLTGESRPWKWTPKQVIEAARNAREFAMAHPMDALDSPVGQFGKWQTMGRYIDPDDVADLTRAIGVEAPTRTQLSDINMLWDNLSLGRRIRGGKPALMNLEQASSGVSRILGNDSDDAVLLIKEFLKRRVDTELSAADTIFSGTSVSKMFRKYQQHVTDMTMAQVTSPIYRFNYQNGLITSFMAKVEGRLRWGALATLDAQIVAPTARMYLLFLNYGPFNVFETMFRGAFRGVNMVKGTFRDVREVNMYVWGDTPNVPFDLFTEAPRGEMWTVTLAGETKLPEISKLAFIEKITPPGVIKPISYLLPTGARERLGAIAARRLPLKLRQVGAKLSSVRNLNLYWAELQGQQRHWYFLNTATKALKEVAPDEMAKILKVYKNTPRLKNRGITTLTKQEIADLEEYVSHSTLTGPDGVRALQGTQQDFIKGKMLRAIDEILAPQTTIDTMYKEAIKEGVASGEIFRVGIDDYIRNVSAGVEEGEIAKVFASAELFDDMARQFAEVPIKSVDELSRAMRALYDMVSASQEKVHMVRKLATERGHELGGVAKDTFHDAASAGLRKYMDAVDTPITNTLTHMRNTANTLRMGDRRRTALLEILDIWEVNHKAAKAARIRDADIISTAKKLAEAEKRRIDWTELNATRETAWNEYDTLLNANQIREFRLMSSAPLSAQPIPTPPSVVDELLPVHISYIFGTTSDDMCRNLLKPETMTLMPREEFISTVRAQAELVAGNVGKTADNIGFNEAAISKCYDRLLRSIGLAPEYARELTPKMLQLEDVRQGLYKIQQTAGISTDDVGKINGWLEDIAKGLDGSGVFDDMAKWRGIKEKAVEQARKWYELDFTDYTYNNMLDALGRFIFPFWTYEAQRYPWLLRTFIQKPGVYTAGGKYMDYCVPTTYKALTRDGWKTCHELVVGDDILVCNPETLTTNWEPLQAVNIFPQNGSRPMLSLPCKGNKKILCTPHHRWMVRSKLGNVSMLEAKDITEQYYSIPTTTPHEFPKDSVLTPEDAAILGWLVTDGTVSKSTKSPKIKSHGQIYQKDFGFALDIGTLLGKLSTSTMDNGVEVFCVPQHIMDRILKVCPSKDSLPSVVTRLSEDATKAMWKAMMCADGNTKGVLAYRNFSQKPGPVLDAFAILSHMLGYRVTIESNSHVCHQVYLSISGGDKSWRRVEKCSYNGEVWCPTVKSGVWIMNAEGQILPTGNSDTGYIHLPGTDMQINPFRGMVFMGGFRRFFLRDYPEYYDTFPGFSQVFDYLGRAGFYPGIHITLPLAFFGAKGTVSRPQLGEILPSWAEMGVNGFLAAFPDSQAAKDLAEVFVPDRYRDYQIMLAVNDMGLDGIEILAKKRAGIELTEAEQSAWNRGLRRIAKFQLLNEQTGLFRFRPDEMRAAYTASAKMIEEMTGVPTDVQEWIWRHRGITGKNFSDYFPGLSPLQQRMLYESTDIMRWTKMAYPLIPSSQQDEMTKVILFWKDVTDKRDKAKTEGIGGIPSYSELDRMFTNYLAGRTTGVEGEEWITPESWIRLTGDMIERLYIAREELHDTDMFRSVPVTKAERIKSYEERGILEPTFHPAQELLWDYYDIKPELRPDPDTGELRRDWDYYWSMTTAIMESLPDDLKDEFKQTLQYEWTPIRKLWWQINREYVRPYRRVRDVTIERYTPEQQAIINRWYVASAREMEALEQWQIDLVNNARNETSIARRNLRLLDPELDAWLNVFGTVDTLLTPQSETAYSRIKSEIIGGIF